MPGEDGYSLMRRVREWEFERGVYIPAVALTAYGRPEDRMRALRSGFQMHVVKPVEPAELAAVITSLIRRPMAPRRLIPAEMAWRHPDRKPHQRLEQERKYVTADHR